MSLLHSVVKVISLSFSDGTWSNQTNVSIQFPVKEIIVKQISYQDSANGFNGIQSNALLYSSLVQNNCLGVVSLGTVNNTTASHLPTQITPGIRYAYRTPQQVSGNFNFWLTNFGGTTYSGTNTGGQTYQMIVICEFICDTGLITNVSI